MKKYNSKLSRCPNGTRRNKTTKLCEPIVKKQSVKKQLIKKSAVKKLKRCPNGTRRNKITNLCDTIVKKQLIKKSAVKKLKRCPNGTRRNKITNNCEPYVKNPIVINKALNPSTIKKSIYKNPNITNFKDNINSYSPSINKNLVSVLKSKDATNILYNKFLGCNSHNLLQELSNKYLEDIKILNNKNECVSAFSDEGQKLLLNNLKLINKINCNNILVPKQLLSNCWFNCFFMTFFISDKGRKFFRFFRQLMITGRHLDNNIIKPDKLRYAFMLLNLAIETSYNFNNNFKYFDLALNTNTIIKIIFDSLKKNSYKFIPNINDAGNPLYYYLDIIKFLKLNNIINIKILNYNNKLFNKSNINKNFKKNPHLIIIEQIDYQKRKAINDVITINSIKYKLDSVIIRNTHKHHFICCFHCNKTEMIYDGASEIKLNSIKWKNVLNKNKEWTLSYKNNNLKQIYYNFYKCYALYFYYRI